ncbi:MAG: hypothetical protein H8E57_10705 [Candidatus Cloacimonetes bacterium]|nr:hypothetical protein [Candidatus Cloacimonadota bacterium]
MISLIRNTSISQRISRVRSMSANTIWLSRRAIKRANPGLDQKELNLKFVAYHYGEKLADHLRKFLESESK